MSVFTSFGTRMCGAQKHGSYNIELAQLQQTVRDCESNICLFIDTLLTIAQHSGGIYTELKLC